MAQTSQTPRIECTEYTRTADGVVMLREHKSGLWGIRRGPRCYFWHIQRGEWIFTGGMKAEDLFANPGPFLMPFETAYHLLETIPPM